MAESKGSRFLAYVPALLDALRSTHPVPMRPAEARAWIRANVEVPQEDLIRFIENGKQSIFENQVHWARFYLAKAHLIGSPKRGQWGLTPEGLSTHLTTEETWSLYVKVRDANRPGVAPDEETKPAPGISDESNLDVAYWFVGAGSADSGDQLPRFLNEGVWENPSEDQFSGAVRRMKAGDRIAIKTTRVNKRGIPFDVGGKPVSIMRINATGTILANPNDGRTVRVAWDPQFSPRDWYLYTYLTTVVEADVEKETAKRLIEFTFRNGEQDYEWFLAQRYWLEKYGPRPTAGGDVEASAITDAVDDEIDGDLAPAYTINDILSEGCFLPEDELATILWRWKTKKNLLLQGPPGTGKTWLAKRLGFALLGSNDREITRSRLRVVQFHPSLTYEDFVRGWRPTGDGRLALVDGILIQAIIAAASEPDQPFVLVIEEINRGNPAQIFGEMLTLLEDTKRRASEAIELAYRREGESTIHIPENLYVIGTMNVADRSLAIVDFALRRRFAFIDLEPNFSTAWHEWGEKRGVSGALLAEIGKRIGELNREISETPSLGPQFRIGHSFVTPDTQEDVVDGVTWFRAKVETEIGPLLDEYWYDAPDRAKAARNKLLAGLE